MTATHYLIAVVVTAALITWALRAIPFAVVEPMRNSRSFRYVAERIPVGIMVILVVYTLRETEVTNPGSVIPVLMALLVTVGLHLWRGSMLLSLGGGTAVYVLLMSTDVLSQIL